jgi:dolichyl-phosphate-mannose-protein mannosyltransferase
LIYIVQCVAFVRTQSLTFDEPVHIAEGLNAWRTRSFAMWNDHPSLVRLWCTLPLLDRRWQMHVAPLDNGGWQVTQIEPDPESIAHRARYMNIVFGATLAWLVWSTARRIFSEGAANFALALFVFSPALVAHFSVVTTDGAATLFIFATAACLVTWRQKPDGFRTVAIGVLLGLLVLAKFSTPVIFVLAVVWMLFLKPDGLVKNPLHCNWGKTGGAVAIAFLVVWAGYFFHVSRLTLHDHHLVATFPNRAPAVYNNVRSNLDFSFPVPAGEYVEGFRNVVRRNRLGQPAYFFGQVSQSGGFRLYYPVAILLKWPAVTLGFFAAGFILSVRQWRSAPPGLWLMASFPAVYFVFAIFARFNIGERHVLPVYPFLLLFAARVWECARPRSPLTVALVLAVFLQFADTLRYAPDYLSYFNVFVPSAESYKLLSDSNLDWGQGLLALRDYEKANPEEKISLAYFGSIDPHFYGIRAQPLAENGRTTGTVVVSATHLTGQYLQQSDAYHWLFSYPVSQVLDHSLYVFRVPPPPEPKKE